MEDDEDIPPFWLQNTAHGGRRHQVSSFFISSGVFIVLLLIIAFFLVFVIVPSFISITSQIFRPHLVKKGWDLLNLVLVVFAIVCGFLNINTDNNNESPSPSYYREQNPSNNGKQEAPRSYPETPPSPRWYDQFQQDRTPRLSRLRSFSSYPDLRRESSWITNDERWRFHDDTHINNYRLSSSDQISPGPPLQLDQEANKPEVHQEHDEVLERTETKDIAVDTVVSAQDKEVVYSPPSPPPIQSPPPPAPPSPPPPPRSPPRPPPPLSKVVQRKVKRTYQDVERERDHRRIEKELEVKNFCIPPPSTPPPPPPPPVFSKSEKRRGKDFLISLRRRRKKQRQKSVENLESFFNLETSLPSFIPPPSPPPPPPPPPPPHFFQNFFSSKKGKTKKTRSVPPPPPPPPPREAVTTRVEARASRTKSQATSVVTTHKPPKALTTTSACSVEDNIVDSGNASPLRPIPPPPPPPPFKIPALKFVLDGDYVRVGSFKSSRRGSPDLESVEDQSEKESSPMAGNNGGGEPVAMPMPLFCPSPDVNTKADNFIARFRAGLRMEKMNSVKGRSNLGPEASLGPETEE